MNGATSAAPLAETTSVLPMRIAGDLCAVPAMAVEEVLGMRRIIAIPSAPAHLPGVVAWRGRAVAVLDLGALLGRGRLAADAPADRMVIIAVADGALAVPAEAVEAVVAVPAARAARVASHRFASSEVEVGGRVMPLLDLTLVAQAILGRGGA